MLLEHQEHGDALQVVISLTALEDLEVETMSYGRIGPRNLRRLLDRDSDLVVTGDAGGRPAARRILLTPQTEAELGPAWLNYEAVERTVADFYPLYREPGRHVAAPAAEGRAIG